MNNKKTEEAKVSDSIWARRFLKKKTFREFSLLGKLWKETPPQVHANLYSAPLGFNPVVFPAANLYKSVIYKKDFLHTVQSTGCICFSQQFIWVSAHRVTFSLNKQFLPFHAQHTASWQINLPIYLGNIKLYQYEMHRLSARSKSSTYFSAGSQIFSCF